MTFNSPKNNFNFKKNNFIFFENQIQKKKIIFFIIIFVTFLFSSFVFKDFYLMLLGLKENNFVENSKKFMFEYLNLFFNNFFDNYFERLWLTFCEICTYIYNSLILRFSLMISLILTLIINLQFMLRSYFNTESEEVDASKTHKLFSLFKEKILFISKKIKVFFKEFFTDYKNEIKIFFVILFLPILLFLVVYLLKICFYSCFSFLFKNNDFVKEIIWLFPVLVFNVFYYSPFVLKVGEIYLLIMFVCLIFDKIRMRKISDKFDLFVQNEAIGLVRKISGKMGSGKTKFNAAVDRRIEKVFVNKLLQEKLEMKMEVSTKYNLSKYENLLNNKKFKFALLNYFDSNSWFSFYEKIIKLLQHKIYNLKEKMKKCDFEKRKKIEEMLEIFENNIQDYTIKKNKCLNCLNDSIEMLNSFDLFVQFEDKTFLFEYFKICLKLSKSLMITNFPLLSAWDTLQKNELRFCNILLKDDLEFVPKEGKRNILSPKTIISLDEYENVFFDEEDETTEKEIRGLANELSIVSQPTHREYALTVCSQKDNAVNKRIRTKSALQVYWDNKVETKTTFFANFFIYMPLYYLISITGKIKNAFFFKRKAVDNYNEYQVEHNTKLRGFVLPIHVLNGFLRKPLNFLNRHFQYDYFYGKLTSEGTEALGAQLDSEIKVKIPLNDYYQKDPQTKKHLFVYNTTNLEGIYLTTGFIEYYSQDTSFKSFNVEFEDIFNERSTYSALANESLGLDFSNSQTKKQKRNKK